MKIELKELEALTTKALKNCGYDDAETATIREMLLYAQLRGNNQGVVKLIGKGIPKNPNAKGIAIEKGNRPLGQNKRKPEPGHGGSQKGPGSGVGKSQGPRYRHRRYFQHFYVLGRHRLCRL